MQKRQEIWEEGRAGSRLVLADWGMRRENRGRAVGEAGREREEIVQAGKEIRKSRLGRGG